MAATAPARARPLGPVEVPAWLRTAAPHLPLAALVVAFAVRFSLLSLSVYDGYGDPPYDLALFDQGIWLLSRLHAPFVTVMGRDLFGDHTAFILLLLVPLYWVWPHVQALLVLQACLLAAAAVPIYAVARRRLGPALATALAGAYLLDPALQWGDLEQFHPEALLVLGITVALWAAIEDHPRVLVVAVVACALVKQDTGYLLVPLGLWVAWRRHRRLGAAIAVGAAVWMWLCFEVIIRAFLGTTSFQADRIPFGGTGGLVRTFVAHQATFWRYAVGQGRPWYLWQLAAPYGLVLLRAPEVAATCVLVVAENTLAAFTYMHQIHFHYSLAPSAVLAMGTAWAVTRLRSRRLQVGATGLVVASALATSTLWGLAPWSNQTYPHWSPRSQVAADLTAATRHVPPGAVVSAWYPVVAHLDHRVRIYMWPTPFRATYWGLYHQEGQRLPFAHQVTYLVLPTDLQGIDAAAFATIAPDFEVAWRQGYATVWRRVR